MLPLIQKEVVDRRGWLQEHEFMEMLAIAQSAPGPISLNTAIFVGYKARGLSGVLFSSLGIILPSFFIILLVAMIFTELKNNPVVERIFKGIRPAVVALIAAPLWRMGKSAGVTERNMLLPILVAFLIWQFQWSPVYFIVMTIVGGICYKKWIVNRLKK